MSFGIVPEHFAVDDQHLIEEWVEHPARVFHYTQLAANMQQV